MIFHKLVFVYLKWSSVRIIIRHDMYLFTDEVSVGFQVHIHESQTPTEESSVVLVPTRRPRVLHTPTSC